MLQVAGCRVRGRFPPQGGNSRNSPSRGELATTLHPAPFSHRSFSEGGLPPATGIPNIFYFYKNYFNNITTFHADEETYSVDFLFLSVLEQLDRPDN
jgi:hypothetical protein